MAEQTEIVTWGGAVGAFLAAVWAAIKMAGKSGTGDNEPQKGDAMDLWQRDVDKALSDHAARLARIEIDRIEQRATMEKLFSEVRAIGESNARIEGALGIKGHDQ